MPMSLTMTCGRASSNRVRASLTESAADTSAPCIWSTSLTRTSVSSSLSTTSTRSPSRRIMRSSGMGSSFLDVEVLASILNQTLDRRARQILGVTPVIEREHAGARGTDRGERLDTSELDGGARDALGDERDEAAAHDGFEHQKCVVELTHHLRMQPAVAEEVVDLPVVGGRGSVLEQRKVLPVLARVEVRARDGHQQRAMDQGDVDVGSGCLDGL